MRQQFSFCNRPDAPASPVRGHRRTAGAVDGIPTLERGNENPLNRVLTAHKSKELPSFGWV